MLSRKQIQALTPREQKMRETLLAGDFYDSYLTLDIIRDSIRLDELWRVKRESDVHFTIRLPNQEQ